MKIRNCLKTTGLVMAISLMFAMPVLAESGYFDFRLEIAEDADSVQYSGNVLKTDDDDYARVTYDSSNIGNQDDMEFTIVGEAYEDDMIYSETVKATANTGTYYLYYTERQAVNGSMYRLKGETFRYYVLVGGDWAP